MTLGPQPQVAHVRAATIHTATWARAAQDHPGQLVMLAQNLPTEQTGDGVATAALLDPVITAYLTSIIEALATRMIPDPGDLDDGGVEGDGELSNEQESYNEGIQQALWMLDAYLPVPQTPWASS